MLHGDTNADDSPRSQWYIPVVSCNLVRNILFVDQRYAHLDEGRSMMYDGTKLTVEKKLSLQCRIVRRSSSVYSSVVRSGEWELSKIEIVLARGRRSLEPMAAIKANTAMSSMNEATIRHTQLRFSLSVETFMISRYVSYMRSTASQPISRKTTMEDLGRSD